jgi:hypothetical protein
MADADIPSGFGSTKDARTEDVHGNLREVVVIGDPTSNAGVAPVDSVYGLRVNDASNALPSTLIRYNFDVNSAGVNLLVAGIAAKVIRIHRLLLQSSGTVTATFESDTDAISFDLDLSAKDFLTLDQQKEPWYVTATEEDLNLFLSAAIQVKGTVYYTQS